MTAPVSADERTVLLLLPSKRGMYPLSTAALSRAQNSRQNLSRDYRDALILDRDGALRRIEQIDVLGPWGNSFARKLLSRLTDAWSISVRLSEPLGLSLEEIKQLIVDCIASRQSVDTMELVGDEGPAQLIGSVHAALSANELLDLLTLPEPCDALDVL